MKTIPNTHCVMCFRKMKPIKLLEGKEAIYKIPFCSNPSCPNYGLLQSPLLPVVKSKK